MRRTHHLVWLRKDPGHAVVHGPIHQLWYTRLHAEGHFVLLNTGGNFGIIHHCVLFEIQCIDGIDQGFLLRLGNAFGWGEIMNRIPAGIELHSLKITGQEP